jgi:2-dehydropantoate 2-reductase
VNVLIVGAGVVGTVYGAQLAAAGHSIAVLTHGQRTDQVGHAGLRIRDALTGTDLETAVDVVTSACDVSYDLVIVAVRYDQLTSASIGLPDLPGQPTLLLFGNNPRGRSGLPPVLSGQVRLGFPGIGGSLADGVVTYARIRQQPTALEAGPYPIIDQLDRTLHQQDFATQRVTNMDGWLAYHTVFVASVSAALYLCDTDAAQLAQDRQTLTLMCRAVSEGFAALRRQGVGGAPAGLAFLHRSPLLPFATSYWAHALRSTMGELCFAAHARHAQAEMQAVGIEAIARVGASDRAPHLHQLLDR